METLTAAVKANDADLVRKLLSQDPALQSQIDEPMLKYAFDTPALIAAAHQDNREMVDALLDAGANINVRTKWWAGGFGVLDTATPALTAYLIDRGAFVDIHAAARLGMLARVTELLSRNPALVHSRGGDGQMPLHFASTIEIAEYLLDHGAQIDARDIDHESTAAQYMAGPRPPRADLARYLISRGAQTDIIMAAALGNIDLVRRHLDTDASTVLVRVSEKAFPKQDPRSGGSIYIYSFGRGKTPHMLAHEFGHPDVFDLLMLRSPYWLRFAQACEVGDEALAKELLAGQPDVAQTLSSEAAGRIVGAAARNDARAVHTMLSAGWPVAATGDRDQTALHWAAWHGNADMVLDLLCRNAPLEVRERDFNGTPLDWALHGSDQHGNSGDYKSTVAALHRQSLK